MKAHKVWMGLIAAGLFLFAGYVSDAGQSLLSLQSSDGMSDLFYGSDFGTMSDGYAAGVSNTRLTLDAGKPLQMAQASPASTGSLSLQADRTAVSAGVGQEFSTWSDLTAVFRPSRWRLPIRVGEPLSFLNWRAWHEAPGRTAKIFAGVVVVVGITAAIASAGGGGGSGGSKDQQGPAVNPPLAPSAPSGGGSKPKPKPRPPSDGGSSSSGGGGGSGGSSGGGSSGDDESPFD